TSGGAAARSSRGGSLRPLFTQHFTRKRLNLSNNGSLSGGFNGRSTWRRDDRCRRHGRWHRDRHRSRNRRLTPSGLLQLSDLVLNSRNNFFVLFRVFKEIRHVQESVSLETDVDECRLHSRKDFGDL